MYENGTNVLPEMQSIITKSVCFLLQNNPGLAMRHFLVFFFQSPTNDQPQTPGTVRFYHMAF